MTRSLRDDDIDEVRRLIETLREELTRREAAQADAGSDAAAELAIEIAQRRRYIDELMADLDDLLTAPDTPGAFQADAAASDAAPNGLAIVIGHSSEGTDKGALGLAPPFPNEASAGRAEYFWNEDLARRIEQKATARSIRVSTFKRRQNGGPGIREAYRLVDRWRPQATVELHFNSAVETARGTETLFGRDGSRPWARALQDQMVALYDRTGRQDRGLKDANVEGRGVQSLTNAVQPSALIEPFFGSNREDAELGIARKDGLADAVVNAFAAFVGLPLGPSDAAPADATADTSLWDALQAAYSAKSVEFPRLKGISFAQWALESGRGRSPLAKRHLNFAGMKWRPFMSDIATKVWYEAHDGGEFYCKFASLEDFITGYWLRLDRHPSYRGWRQATATPESFFSFIADIWAPPDENPNYKPKVLSIYEEYKDVFDSTRADVTAAILSDEDLWVDLTDEDLASRRANESAGDALARADAQSSVSWAADEKSCDYAHLGAGLPVGMQFALAAADLDLLCTLNDFPVNDSGGTPILFGLRGAAIVQGGSSTDGAWRDEVLLKNIRPNHHEARCVMGVWDRQQGKLAVYPGSTVPHAEAVVSWFKHREAGNLLPTGFYRYVCGEHNGRPGCFLLRKSISVESRRKVIVRRTADDLIYEGADIFQNTAPGDNIHPTFSSETGWFSSFGCQVVVGTATRSGQHSGPWAKFRRSAGLLDANGEPGRQFVYVVLTGQEALMASETRRRGQAIGSPEVSALRRIRFGSQGDRVSTLQARLGVQADRELGPATAEALHKKQSTLENRSDGIYTPKLDAQLGWGIFGLHA
jgi:N-acetylmuramoyl-L-alanine amidase